MGGLPEDVEGDGKDGEQGGLAGGRARAHSGATGGLGLPGVTEEDDEDRVDARNAASRLATSTF